MGAKIKLLTRHEPTNRLVHAGQQIPLQASRHGGRADEDRGIVRRIGKPMLVPGRLDQLAKQRFQAAGHAGLFRFGEDHRDQRALLVINLGQTLEESCAVKSQRCGLFHPGPGAEQRPQGILGEIRNRDSIFRMPGFFERPFITMPGAEETIPEHLIRDAFDEQ